MTTTMMPDKDELRAKYAMDRADVRISPEERSAAVLMVAGYSKNAEDFKMLLDYLGLTPSDRVLP